MGVKILDAGGKLVMSGEVRAEVEAMPVKYTQRGSAGVAEIQRVGNLWVAACTLPEFNDGCKVEEVGFKRLITGPTRRAVELRLEHLKQFGTELVGDIEEQSGSWVAVADPGGADKTYKY